MRYKKVTFQKNEERKDERKKEKGIKVKGKFIITIVIMLGTGWCSEVLAIHNNGDIYRYHYKIINCNTGN